jgi:translocation and assembly module TamA
MARRGLVLVTLLALGGAGCMSARARPTEEPVLYGLELQGVHAFDEDAILARLATQPSDRFAWQEARRLDPDALAVDARRVEAFYRERGYYDARVADVQVIPAGSGRARVVLRVSEGSPVRVTAVEVIGLEEAPQAAERVRRLPLRPGEVFNEGDYDASRGAILGALKGTGWATATVSQQAQVLPAEHTAHVVYRVEPGPRLRFGAVGVSGGRAVARERVRSQATLEIHPGDWYDEAALAKAQARVFQLGVFGAVRVTAAPPDLRRGIVAVDVNVVEAPFRTLRAGPGVGIQANTRWDVNGMVGWTNRNFVGGLRKLQLELRAGYAWLVAPPRKEGPVALFAAEFSQPSAISSRIDAATRFEVERGIEQAYAFWSERLKVSFPIRFTQRLVLVPSWNVDVYQLENAVNFDPNQPSSDNKGPELQNCRGTPARPVCLLSYLQQSLQWDGRNDAVNPRRGLAVTMVVQEGFAVSGYGYRYLRFVPEARGYLPLGSSMVLAARTRFGMLVPVNEAGQPPIVARFNGGGPQSQRGYYTGRLSPMVLRSGNWVPVGGNGMVDGSIELRIDLSRSWGGALFVDAGNVSRPSAVPNAYQSALDPTLLQWAAGMGLRYRTPFGPIRFDVGAQIPTDLASGVPFERRFPTVPAVENAGAPIYDRTGAVVGYVPAAHREPWIAFHVSVGEAF